MIDKPDDPLAGIQEKGWLCPSCEGAIDWKNSPCYCKRNDKRTRLLPEPAVRAAMVEWLKKRSKRKLQESMNLWNSKKPLDQANKRDKAFALSEAATECDRIADRIETGGDIK